MKRVHPESNNPCIADSLRAIFPEKRDIFSYVPGDIVALVLGCLRLSDAGAVSRTSKYFSVLIPNNGGLWERLFQHHFSNLPRLAPHLSWLGQCQVQFQCTRNIIAGVHTLQEIPIGQINSGEKARCFALDEKGNMVIGYENGRVAILDPKTEKSELLLDARSNPISSIKTLICKNGFYAACSDTKVEVWNSETKENIFSINMDGEMPIVVGHMKVFDGRLLVSGVQHDIAAMRPEIRIWDIQSKELLHQFQLGIRPTDIVLCGNTCILAFPKGHIQVVDLESKLVEDHYFGTYAHRIHPLNKRTLFLSNERSGEIFLYSLDDPEKKHEVSLWSDYAGIPKGFEGHLISILPDLDSQRNPLEEVFLRSDTCCYSLEELSSLFHTFTSEQFHYLDRRNKNAITGLLSKKVCTDFPCVFDYGKAFYFSPNKEAIICLDFVASHEVILQQLAQMLGESSGNFQYAEKILERFPMPVQDEIKKNHSEISLQPHTDQAQPSPAFDIKGTLAPTKDLTLQQISQLLDLLKAQKESIDAKFLRQAILQYLEHNPK